MIKVLLVAHFLGDFYLQNKKLHDSKTKWYWLLMHAFIYSVTVALFFSIFKHNWWQMLLVFGLCFFSHIIIDKIKMLIDKKSSPKTSCIIFVLDQMIHIVILFTISSFQFISHEFNILGNSLYSLKSYFNISNVSGLILTIIVILYPTSLFIIKVFETFTKKETLTYIGIDMGNNGLAHTGKIIGYLERITIVILYISQQYSMIGLVLTAKSIARFKLFDEQGFAEKFLIGTLLSLVITIITLYLSSNLIAA